MSKSIGGKLLTMMSPLDFSRFCSLLLQCKVRSLLLFLYRDGSAGCVIVGFVVYIR